MFVALAEAHNRLAEWDDAARVAQSGLLSHPDSVAGRLALAVAEAGRGHVREALEQIKRALINDQENPRALALMGSLLLEKGLAKRAVQFLSKAVKLAPDSREYGDLLRRARRLALQDPDVPISRADAIADDKNPWNELAADETEFAPPGDPPKRPERTVYDPEGILKARPEDVKASERKAEFERALAQLGGDDEPRRGDAEPTQYGGPKPGARRSQERRPPTSPFSVEGPDAAEERTTHELHQLSESDLGAGALRNPDVSGLPKKPKMGGSAAEYSRMIKSDEEEPGSGRLGAAVPQVSDRGEFTFAAPEGALAGGALFEPPTVDGVARDVLEKKNGSSPRIQSEVKSNKSLPAVDPEPRSNKSLQALDGTGKAKIIKARDAKERSPDTTDEERKGESAEAPPQKKVDSDPAPAKSKRAPPPPPDRTIEKPPEKVLVEKAPEKPPERVLVERAPEPAPEPPKEAAKEPAKEAPAKAQSKVKEPEPPPPAKEPEVAAAPAPAPAPKAKKEKAAPAAEPAEAAAAPAASGERPATMFVDDAVWKLYGSEKPQAPKADAPKVDAPAEKKPAHEKAKPAADGEGGGDRRQGMVVRTSERFGAVTRWTAIAVVAGAVGIAGYALAQRRSGAGDVDVRDEKLIEVATDLERGGLARLSSAEETLEQLLPVAPELAPIAHAALAEIRGRTWADFGKNPKVREKAKQDLAALAGRAPTIEALAGRVALSTSTKELGAIEAQLAEVMKRHPRSPKALLLRAEIADRLGRPDDVARSLYAARTENPRRRDTLLALARWNGARGAHAAAFSLFDELNESFPEDVEAALDRWILGQITGADPAMTEAAGRLAGLVREEIPEVAKDEAGRVALAFGVAALARGDRDEGLLQLGRAGAAFEGSAEFKSALGSVYLALGDWAQAKEHFEKAIAADPAAAAPRIGRARALYGEDSQLAPPKEPKLKAGARGEAVLPFGRARLVFARFTPVEVAMSGAFPEAAYASAAGKIEGAELDRALEAANVISVAVALRTKDPKRAVEILERAREKSGRDPSLDTELGRAYLAAGELDRARRAFESALAKDGAHHAARYGLAMVHLEQKRPAFDAIGLLEPLTESGVVMPDALRLLAKLKKQSGDYAAAFQVLERAREVEELSPALQEELGELHHLLGRKEEAFHAYRRASELEPPGTDGRQPRAQGRGKALDDPSGVDLYYRGRVNLERNEKKALALLTSAMKKDDVPPEAHFWLGKTLIKKPRTKKQGRKELEIYRRLVPDGELSSQAERLIRGR